ncbi:hypothetical protein RchiOBHm_Chr4g0402541 [Rosa chinensis]|uniref:Uncharacterized protein n=1 Tax=Rosa chinensis TaxID=74649 RepID=A0A2P6QTC1_ROSCH|nr:hypothetical protein RchiOBHm_Chr4g0402541 [Rosa chinensis]
MGNLGDPNNSFLTIKPTTGNFVDLLSLFLLGQSFCFFWMDTLPSVFRNISVLDLGFIGATTISPLLIIHGYPHHIYPIKFKYK